MYRAVQAVLNLFGLPIMLVYGMIRGFGQLPHFLVLEMVGALLGRFYFHKRFGQKRFLTLAPALLAGYFTGVGLLSMADHGADAHQVGDFVVAVLGTHMEEMHIQDQVDLSFGTALGIVIQGFRIRLGRSLVTIFGVVLGIAFLMSNLTNQTLKEAVRDEEQTRSAVRRMMSFLTAETGPVAGKTMGVVQDGTLSDTEKRFLRELQANGLAGLRWFADADADTDGAPIELVHRVGSA